MSTPFYFFAWCGSVATNCPAGHWRPYLCDGHPIWPISAPVPVTAHTTTHPAATNTAK